MHRSLGLGLAALLLVGCGEPDPGPVVTTADSPYRHPITDDPWVVACTDSSQTEPAYLGGRVAGFRISRNACSLSLLAKVGYEKSGEEKLLAPPTDLKTSWELDGKALAMTGIEYRQQLNLKSGVLTTQYQAGSGVQVKVLQRVDPETSALAEQWNFVFDTPRLLTMRFSPSPDARTEGGHYVWRLDERYPVAVRHGGQTRVLESLQAGVLVATAGPASQITITRTIGIQADNLPSPDRVLVAPGPDIPEISIDGPRDDQDAVRAMLFYLESLGRSQPPSPFGWSNTTYFGHAFWDADVWVLPAAALLLPDVARSIAEYRLRLGAPHDQHGYRANYKRWATAEASEIGLKPLTEPPALMVPWESSLSGLETVPGPSRLQHHITGSVLWGLTMAEAFGLIREQEGSLMTAFVSGADQFWRQRSNRRPDGLFEVRRTMSPDEFHVGDNDLYTNLLAQWSTNDRSWKQQSRPFYLPKDDRSFLTYDHDRLRSYKQAAAVLAIYPLQFPPAEAQALTMLSRFADKVTENGPAMSDSIHATILARYGNADEAYERWRASWQPFTDHPLLLFSEKKRKAVTYFTTGAGGCLQAFLYGLLGFRVDDEAQAGSKWSLPLQAGKVLSIRPRLPSAWRSVTIRGVRLMGRKFDFTISNEAVNVEPKGA
ncbi:MAG: hypothetical protein HONBIEJF_02992 [Fimbriimonadaceae bacterium]|nr:hypothetical protein [Fimbriimonadaceae bacterium]